MFGEPHAAAKVSADCSLIWGLTASSGSLAEFLSLQLWDPGSQLLAVSYRTVSHRDHSHILNPSSQIREDSPGLLPGGLLQHGCRLFRPPRRVSRVSLLTRRDIVYSTTNYEGDIPLLLPYYLSENQGTGPAHTQGE